MEFSAVFHLTNILCENVRQISRALIEI